MTTTPAVPSRPFGPAASGEAAPRIYVLDTSVLLADPRAMVRFDEHAVVLPVVVILELESKRKSAALRSNAVSKLSARPPRSAVVRKRFVVSRKKNANRTS